MKKCFLTAMLAMGFVICVWLSAAATAQAAEGGGFTGNKGGFTGPGPAVVSVEQARGMRDDAKVHLSGNIIQHLGKDKYLFRDASGTIHVEIDHDKWGGQSVGPEDLVEIYGEVDKDWNSVEIDVDRIVKK